MDAQPAYMRHMDLHYQEFHRQAEQLQTSFHARLSDPFNPVAILLKSEADRLVADIESNSHPRDIEERIKRIQVHLARSRDTLHPEQGIISEKNGQVLNRGYDQIRRQLHEMPNYNVGGGSGLSNEQYSHHPTGTGGAKQWL